MSLKMRTRRPTTPSASVECTETGERTGGNEALQPVRML